MLLKTDKNGSKVPFLTSPLKSTREIDFSLPIAQEIGYNHAQDLKVDSSFPALEET